MLTPDGRQVVHVLSRGTKEGSTVYAVFNEFKVAKEVPQIKDDWLQEPDAFYLRLPGGLFWKIEAYYVE